MNEQQKIKQIVNSDINPQKFAHMQINACRDDTAVAANAVAASVSTSTNDEWWWCAPIQAQKIQR